MILIAFRLSASWKSGRSKQPFLCFSCYWNLIFFPPKQKHRKTRWHMGSYRGSPKMGLYTPSYHPFVSGIFHESIQLMGCSTQWPKRKHAPGKWSASGLQPLETGIAEVVTYPNFLRQHPSIVKIRLWAMPCPDATRGIRVAKGCAVPATFLIDRLEAAVSPPSWESPNGGFLNGRSPNYGLFYTQMV